MGSVDSCTEDVRLCGACCDVAGKAAGLGRSQGGFRAEVRAGLRAEHSGGAWSKSVGGVDRVGSGREGSLGTREPQVLPCLAGWSKGAWASKLSWARSAVGVGWSL